MKKPSLRDLSKEMPTVEEFSEFLNSIETKDARSAALSLVAFVDNLLEIALKFQFVDLSPQDFDKIFRNHAAPLSSFSSKSTLGYALGLYGDEIKTHLELLRTVRNAFAHSVKDIDFDEDRVAAVCRKMKPENLVAQQYQPTTDSNRERFVTTANLCAIAMSRLITAGVQAKLLGPDLRPMLRKLGPIPAPEFPNPDETTPEQ